MSPTETLDDIRTRAATAMRGYIANEGAARTLHSKAAAEALVEARTHFFTRDGGVDYLGRSGDYRRFVAEALDEAGVPASARANIQAAIRYHVSPLLRERFGEEVAELGLDPDSSVDRARRRRERDARIVALFSGGSELTDLDDISAVANSARLAVSRISGFAPETTPEKAERVRGEWARLYEAVKEAQKRLG